MAQIKLKCIEAGETVIQSKWSGTIRVDGSELLAGYITFDAVVDQEIVITVDNDIRWTDWNKNIFGPLVSGGKWECTEMPPMETFCIAPGVAGDSFFAFFNYRGSLTSLPEGSFDLSGITEVGDSFFASFNNDGSLVSLPEGSFDLSGITEVENNFFRDFNSEGSLVSLPEGSFDLSGITVAGDSFFSAFNNDGSLTSLPEGSFDLSGITEVGDNFFYAFNYRGSLTSLPEGSFDLSGITKIKNNFFYNFNNKGSLVSLPEGSFDLSGITEVENNFFYAFNSKGSLVSLPEGSFDLSGITVAGEGFLVEAFSYSPIKTLPRSFALPENLSSCPGIFIKECFLVLRPGDEETGVPLYFACDSEMPVLLPEEMKPEIVFMIEEFVKELGDISEEEAQAAIQAMLDEEFYPGFTFDPDEPFLSIEGILENDGIVPAGPILYVEANPDPELPSGALDKLLSGAGLKTFWREFVPKPAIYKPIYKGSGIPLNTFTTGANLPGVVVPKDDSGQFNGTLMFFFSVRSAIKDSLGLYPYRLAPLEIPIFEEGIGTTGVFHYYALEPAHGFVHVEITAEIADHNGALRLKAAIEDEGDIPEVLLIKQIFWKQGFSK